VLQWPVDSASFIPVGSMSLAERSLSLSVMVLLEAHHSGDDSALSMLAAFLWLELKSLVPRRAAGAVDSSSTPATIEDRGS
jgi:hypothetical protein